MSTPIARAARDLPGSWTPADCPPMALPSHVLMASPDFFEVRDVKNVFMRDHVGNVDREAAFDQWRALRNTFERIGIGTYVLRADAQCEDMVFAANPAFNGRSAGGEALCIPSRMAFPSREKEVPAHSRWFETHGYRIVDLPGEVRRFEGGGDALWHPGRALIWAGSGARTEPAAHAALSATFGVPVLSLELADPRFYHLDTCFCALSESTVLLYPPAFTPDGLELIHRVFPTTIDACEDETTGLLACNAAAFFNRDVVIQKGAVRVSKQLADLGFKVHEVETREFIKAGGSVFCMNAALY